MLGLLAKGGQGELAYAGRKYNTNHTINSCRQLEDSNFRLASTDAIWIASRYIVDAMARGPSTTDL